MMEINIEQSLTHTIHTPVSYPVNIHVQESKMCVYSPHNTLYYYDYYIVFYINLSIYQFLH